jgi:hypothetical protein
LRRGGYQHQRQSLADGKHGASIIMRERAPPLRVRLGPHARRAHARSVCTEFPAGPAAGSVCVRRRRIYENVGESQSFVMTIDPIGGPSTGTGRGNARAGDRQPCLSIYLAAPHRRWSPPPSTAAPDRAPCTPNRHIIEAPWVATPATVAGRWRARRLNDVARTNTDTDKTRGRGRGVLVSWAGEGRACSLTAVQPPGSRPSSRA